MFLIGSVFLVSCASNDSIDSNSEQLLFFLSSIYLNGKYEVVIKKNGVVKGNFLVDDNSYIDKKSELTYYKYTYKSDYQIYNGDSVSDGKSSISYISNLNKLVNVAYFNENNFNIINGCYYVKNGVIKLFDFSFIDEEITTFFAYYYDNKVVFDVTTSLSRYTIEYYKSHVEILPHGVDIDDYNSFYDSINIYYNDLSRFDDFVLVLTRDNCYPCEVAESDLFDFKYEYNYDNFKRIDVNTLYINQNSELKELTNEGINLISMIQKAYISKENEEFYNSRYENYDRYLTPTLVRFYNGNIKYVGLGVDKTNVNSLIKMCF